MATPIARQIREIYSACAAPLYKVLEGLSEEQLRWKPAPDSRSIGQMARHLIRVDNWFLQRQGFSPVTGDPGEEAGAGQILAAMQQVHGQVQEILEHSDEDRLRRRHEGEDAGEHETLAEVILHMAQHYLYHLAQMIYLRRAQDREWSPPLKEWEAATHVLAGHLAPVKDLWGK